MRGIGDRHQASIAEVAIAFVLSRPGVGSCILGARSSKHIQSSLKACSLRLTANDLKEIEAVTATSSGPLGPVYALERDRHGRHGVIMRYNLQELGTQKHVVELLRRISKYREHVEAGGSLKTLSHEQMRERLLQELDEVERDANSTTLNSALIQQLDEHKKAMQQKLW